MSDQNASNPPAPDGAPAALLEKLRDKIVQWRQKAAVTDSFHATMGTGWKVCADELGALLADPAGWDVHGYENKKSDETKS